MPIMPMMISGENLMVDKVVVIATILAAVLGENM
jgi:hypothetical protein